MPLYTKSVQSPVSKSDGVRICIMRRPDANVTWDIWIPHLAPTHDVLTLRHEGKMTKQEFNLWFKKHILNKKNKYLEILIEMAKKRKITILCWEEDPVMCHRKLVADYCKILCPELNVVIR